MHHQYSELPLEEKQGEIQSDSANELPRWRRKTIIWTVSLLTVASLLILGFGLGVLDTKVAKKNLPVEDANSEWLARTRAAGDQYLLGVGKADITG